MQNVDARSLSPQAQEALRKRAVLAVVSYGMKQVDVARSYGVAPAVVSGWVKRYREGGIDALNARRKGPAPGTGCRLTPRQSTMIQGLIMDKCPDQMKLPFALWTREAVRDLILRRCKVRVAVRTVGNYLREWGFSPQKPVRRAYERSDSAVRQWLEETYPEIARRAKEEKALIFWGDEMGLRSDDPVGRTYGKRGKTPAIPRTGKRFGCSMISAVTNQGHLCFRVFQGNLNSELFLDFVDRLIRQTGRKLFLIVDGHPAHRSRLVQEWRERHHETVQIHYLPAYSPELNPDEMLNQDVKANVSRHGRPRDVEELTDLTRSYLASTQRQPQIVRNYFQEKHVRYARAEGLTL